MKDRDRFDKFTERARKVLSLAQEEAQRFQHNYIGTEHLLLGLVRERDGAAAKVLASLGIDLNKVRDAVEFIIGRGDRIVLGEIGLTPRAKKVIEFAVDEARRSNHHYIGTEHLLLGLVRESEGIAAGVLESVGVNLENVRRQTIQVLRHQDRFNKFTEEAILALSLAQKEAQRFQHPSVDTEHLLLGLLCEGEGVAAKVLTNLGIKPSKVRNTVALVVGFGDSAVMGEIDLTPRAKKVIELAVDEARRRNQQHAGTEHLLLSLVHEGEGPAIDVLRHLNVNLEDVRTQTIQALGGSDTSSDTSKEENDTSK